MLLRSHMQSEMELLKWFVLIVLAGAIALLFAGPVAGAAIGGAERPRATDSTPGVLPTEREPVPNPTAEPPSVAIRPEPFELASAIWEALEAQQAGQAAEALEMWKTIELPRTTEVWRQIAMAMADLSLNQSEEAADLLNAARRDAPENGVVYYVTGILRLTQAETADEWYDAVGPAPVRLAALGPVDVAPNTRSMYELAAMMAFERAIALAPAVRRTAPLLPEAWTVPDNRDMAMPVTTPTVADLLAAIDAGQFEGRSHLVLGEMHRERGSLMHAEEHLDLATALGVPAGEAFRRLGQAYEDAGRHGDATRAYLKAVSHGGGVAAPLDRALENLRRSLRL